MAESPDSKASKSLTFRLPNEIYSELEQFAIARGLLKSDGAIKTTDALIAVIKQGLGLSHGVSQNVSISDVDIQAMIDNAIAPLLSKIDQLEDEYKDAIINAKHEMRLFVIKGLTGAIDKPYFGIEETSETSLNTEVQPVDDAIATIPTEAIASTEPRENLADKRFTSMAAAAYYRRKSGQPLKQTTLIQNAKKYGFVILEKGSGLYALIEAQTITP